MVTIFDRASPFADELGQRRLALFQRDIAKVVTVEIEEVEGKIDESGRLAVGQRLLKVGKACPAIRLERRDLAVENGVARGPEAQHLGKLGKPLGPVEPGAG